MNLNGEIVKHKKFGIGIVVETKSDYIIVQFHETKEQKKFVYPDALEEFLELQSKSSLDNKEKNINEIETGHENEHEQKRIKNIKGIIKRENIIKKIIGIRQREGKG
jgi:hypothetical protein